MPERLPIYEIEQDIIARLKENRRLVLSAPTGSGKSTQVPQMLLKHGFLKSGQAVILQPRRLAARLLGARVAEELGVPLGREVGYQIRLENVTGPETRIKYVTEGVLLRQMIQEPKLSGVSTVIFDEFHERHLYGDITLARALELQEKERPDLLILVMSATLDSELLANYLKPCSVVASAGRMYPVEIKYAAKPSYNDNRPVWEQAADAFGQYVRDGGAGDVLVFMPGSFEISQTIQAVRDQPESKGFILLPLHGELQPRDQDAAVARYGQPKVVVSTNVAETSLTIDGIRLVIDSGLARIPRYDPYRGINTLLIEKISRASADQRTGRAGRTAPGRCIRLWSEEEHGHRPMQELPEIKRLDLSEVVLTLKSAGVANLRKFRWLEAPEEQALDHAEELLSDLGALGRTSENTTAITELGRRMLAFPAHPRYSRMLLAAEQYGCVYQACLIASLTQGRDLLLRNVDRNTTSLREDLFGEKASSDFWILMRAWTYAAKNNFRMDACRKLGIHAATARQVGPLLDQFLRLADREGLDIKPREIRDEALQKCILTGFSDHVARRLDQGTLRCELVHGRRGALARESVVQGSPLFVAAEVREVEGKDKSVNTMLSLATAIEPGWLQELFPADIKSEPHVFYDPATKRVYAEEQLRFRDLALERRRIEPPPPGAAAPLLADEILAGRLVLHEWDHGVDQWILRLRLLSQSCPELGLPVLTDDDRRYLVEQLCDGGFSYKEIKDRPVKPVVKSWLSAAQQDLVDKHAPERLELSNDRTPKVTYAADGSPFIALRIQELFGVTQTPKIAMNRVPVLVHILAPNMRPVQITQDLANFWKEQYPKVKQELQRKYPKHEWR
ncbi:MAG: ATP-dependent helicase HrpB [Verrucomicrobia bacterium]|nr:ATP-dependent helicase HrpB [Verrucomicrobiota bacterium]